jgi:hypothetical protein
VGFSVAAENGAYQENYQISLAATGAFLVPSLIGVAFIW